MTVSNLVARVVARSRKTYSRVASKPNLDIRRDTITLLHGTTALNAEQIRKHGFKASDALEIVKSVAKDYRINPRAVFDSVYFEFAKGRRDRDHVHFTSLPDTAAQYTIPEVVQDALKAIWEMTFGTKEFGEDVSRERSRALEAWVKREGDRLAKPEILAVTMPWKVVGDHAFGRKIETMAEYIAIYDGDADEALQGLHSISIPIRALKGIRISAF